MNPPVRNTGPHIHTKIQYLYKYQVQNCISRTCVLVQVPERLLYSRLPVIPILVFLCWAKHSTTSSRARKTTTFYYLKWRCCSDAKLHILCSSIGLSAKFGFFFLEFYSIIIIGFEANNKQSLSEK
jgi:hypothetical protein